MEKHEKWFADNYLGPLGLHNKVIRANDFEGLICDSNNNGLAIFELKCITLQDLQQRVIREFKEVDSKRLIRYPQADNIRSRLRDIICGAKSQVLKKESSSVLPRIIFLILDTPDVRPVSKISIRSAVKGKEVLSFPDCLTTFENERSNNQEAIDPFYDQDLSGIVCILNQTSGFSVTVLKNKKSTIGIPSEFLIKVPWIRSLTYENI